MLQSNQRTKATREDIQEVRQMHYEEERAGAIKQRQDRVSPRERKSVLGGSRSAKLLKMNESRRAKVVRSPTDWRWVSEGLPRDQWIQKTKRCHAERLTTAQQCGSSKHIVRYERITVL
ncbi:hypothetical protein L596_001647 [Steinernema carpocapsae]|uniref:Uncharacterized protein n=1 Tax=Steinernema carpocapsae TaxID=34508 RepID=A0A4V6YSU0_STECR|nr:hypothetical protein L596_001647 [Steinernema carpocapsae]